MAFPSTLDDFTPKVDNTNDVMAIDINELQIAIKALQDKVGADNSTVTTSQNYKINNLYATKKNAVATNLTPLSVKGGVVRNIDQATGDIARTTNGWIEDEKYGVFLKVQSNNASAEFDSVVTRTGRLTLKLSNTSVGGACFAEAVDGGGDTYDGNRSKLIPIKASTNYKLTVYAKTFNAAANSVYIQGKTWDSNFTNRATLSPSIIKLSGTQDWTKLELPFKSGASQVYFTWTVVNFVAGNISDAWFDVNSMTLEEVSTINNTSSSPALYYPKATAVTSNDNIDQSQVVKDGSLAFGGSGSTDQVAGMLFIPTKKNGTGIVIQRVANTGTYTGDVIISLMGDANSKPSGTNLITPITIPNATWNALAVNTDYTVSIPYTLTPGSRYYAIFDSSTKDTSNHPNIRCGVAVGGRYYYNGTVWSSVQASYAPYIKTLYSKNTTNFTVRTDTQEVSVTAPTVDGWADGTVIDSADYGVTPLTLAPGVNNIYYSSNGSNLADGATDESLQAIIEGTIYGEGKVSLFDSGTTAPSSTPISVGQVYVDTTAKKVYISTGITSSSDWTILN